MGSTQAIYRIKSYWKWLFLLLAVSIAGITFFYSNNLIKKLKKEELKKIKIWGGAYRQLGALSESDPQLDYFLEIIQSNTTIPIIAYNPKEDRIVSYSNLPERIYSDSALLRMERQRMSLENDPIPILGFLNSSEEEEYLVEIHYGHSQILSNLEVFPYILLLTMAFFLIMAYWAFSVSRNSEQSMVWAGMAKETAHQIGTPLSSLLGWHALLQTEYPKSEYLKEMSKDLERLTVITNRFSKIGTEPDRIKIDAVQLVHDIEAYFSKRKPKQITIQTRTPAEPLYILGNHDVLSWVIENLVRNSIDALEGSGLIGMRLSEKGKWIILDLLDNGKGLKRNMHKLIFHPGFSTKKRGWGLGLSLSKRIIEKYHQGRIFVLKSEPEKGTVIRIQLNKWNP